MLMLYRTAAIFADMYGNETRGLAVAVFSATVFMGPLFAPFIGGFIVDSYLGWRWTVSSPVARHSSRMTQGIRLNLVTIRMLPSHPYFRGTDIYRCT